VTLGRKKRFELYSKTKHRELSNTKYGYRIQPQGIWPERNFAGVARGSVHQTPPRDISGERGEKKITGGRSPNKDLP